MSGIDWNYYGSLKDKFAKEYCPKIEALGYNMAHGFGLNHSEDPLLEHRVLIAVRLQPLPGSSDPIDENLLKRIKEEILGDNYEGVKLDIRYIGRITAR